MYYTPNRMAFLACAVRLSMVTIHTDPGSINYRIKCHALRLKCQRAGTGTQDDSSESLSFSQIEEGFTPEGAPYLSIKLSDMQFVLEGPFENAEQLSTWVIPDLIADDSDGVSQSLLRRLGVTQSAQELGYSPEGKKLEQEIKSILADNKFNRGNGIRETMASLWDEKYGEVRI